MGTFVPLRLLDAIKKKRRQSLVYFPLTRTRRDIKRGMFLTKNGSEEREGEVGEGGGGREREISPERSQQFL